jgi:hypothetical protein
MELEEIVNCELSLGPSAKVRCTNRLFAGRSLNRILKELGMNP